MKSLGIAILSALLILGMGAAVVAQQITPAPPSATDQAKPGDDKASSEPKATTPPGPGAPSPAAPSASVDTQRQPGEATETPGIAGGAEGSASPRTERSARIFGLDPTAAALIGAGILIIVIIALVAMARNDSTATARTNIDFDRRL